MRTLKLLREGRDFKRVRQEVFIRRMAHLKRERGMGLVVQYQDLGPHPFDPDYCTMLCVEYRES